MSPQHRISRSTEFRDEDQLTASILYLHILPVFSITTKKYVFSFQWYFRKILAYSNCDIHLYIQLSIEQFAQKLWFD